jgi:hypothetical protein
MAGAPAALCDETAGIAGPPSCREAKARDGKRAAQTKSHFGSEVTFHPLEKVTSVPKSLSSAGGYCWLARAALTIVFQCECKRRASFFLDQKDRRLDGRQSARNAASHRRRQREPPSLSF